MPHLVCGRCGQRTAENSTYCSNCRWTLYGNSSVVEPGGAGFALGEPPRPKNTFLARRRVEMSRSHLERTLRAIIDPRLEKLEKSARDKESATFEEQRAMGILSILEGHWERAEAHFQRALELNRDDLETRLHLGVVMAHRGRAQAALDLLEETRRRHPAAPLVLLNLALTALAARRPNVVLEAVEQLERLWFENPAIAVDFHDSALTVRGIALLELGRATEARAAFEAAARHTVSRENANAVPSANLPVETEDGEVQPVYMVETGEAGGTPTGKPGEVPGEGEPTSLVLEGKIADADLLNNLALAEAALGQTEMAVQRLHAAARMEPGNARVLNNLGVLAYRQGAPQQALKFLELAHDIEEATGQVDPATWNHRGVVMTALGDLEGGMEQFQHAGSHERAEFEVFYNLARSYFEHGKPDRGLEVLQQAYASNPNHPDLHVLLGAAYLLRGQKSFLGKVFEHLKRALQLDPHHAVAFVDLVQATMEMGNEEGALRAIRQALREQSRNAPILYLLALISMDHGDEKHLVQAIDQFNGALRVRPEWPAGMYNVGLCNYLMGLGDVASQQWRAVTAHDPAFAPAYFMTGVGHVSAKRFQDAMTAWQIAEKYEPHNPDLQANMGFIHYKRGNWQQAIKCYAHAHRLLPADTDILDALGLAYARAQMLKQAIAVFVQSLQLKPNSPVTHSNIGLAYYIAKHVETAVEHWRTVSQLDAKYAEKRAEEQQRAFDDGPVSLRPLNWRARMVKLAPLLPPPHTRLLPGYNASALRLMISDPKLREADATRLELERVNRTLAWLTARH